MDVTYRFASRSVLLAIVVLMVQPAPAFSESWGALKLLDKEVQPGTSLKMPFTEDQSFAASYVNMPVFVARGEEPGANAVSYGWCTRR